MAAALIAVGIALAGGGCALNATRAPDRAEPGASTALFENLDAAPDAPIGVFDRTALLIAYYSSQHSAKALQGLRDERNAALAARDYARAASLEQQGAALQDVAHRQLRGEAPLTNVASVLEADLPAIARGAGVSRIIDRAQAPPHSRTIDVTHQLTRSLSSAH